MTDRREFPNRIKAQIVLRATDERGRAVCEGCGLVLGKKPYEIDHTIPEALVVDKSRELTAADGKLLGKACCHAPKTKGDVARIAKAVRQSYRDKGIKGPSSFRKPPPGYGYDWKRGRYTKLKEAS